jgi:multidrug resistance efflux pump
MTYKPIMPNLPGLVTANVAAQRLGIPHSSIYYKIHHQLIRYERLAGHYYIRESTIDNILASRKALESLYQAQQYLDGVAITARENAALIAQAQKAAALAALAPE